MKTFEHIVRVGNRYPPELFYVLGALLGDGCAYKWRKTNGHRLILAGDHAFAWKYAGKISLCIGRNVKAYPNRRQHIWFVSTRNDEVAALFLNIRKGHLSVLRLMEQGDSEMNCVAFVEGFFDAEGCVKIVREPVRKIPKICLDITNTNFELLESVRLSLKSGLEIEARYSSQEAYLSKDGSPRKKSYHLRIYKKSDVKKFLENISTTKLTEKKKPAVREWLSVDNCNTRFFRNSSLLAASSRYSTKP